MLAHVQDHERHGESCAEPQPARHVLELCAAEGLVGITSLICRKVMEHGERHVDGKLKVQVVLVDFNGSMLGQCPQLKEEAS